MKLAVIGAGYVGCVSAACLADLGHDVLALDTDPVKVALLAVGQSPVLEPGLDALVARGFEAGRLRAAAPSEVLLADCDLALVCVATPSRADGSVDERPMKRVFSFLASAARDRAPIVVAVRSTIAPLILRRVIEETRAAAGDRLRVVLNPEFLRETTAIRDFERPPFIIVGGDDENAMALVARLGEGVGIAQGRSIDAPVYLLDLETAAFVKYASNAFHGVKAAFANELGQLARVLGADPVRAMGIFVQDRILNVSPAYLRPGFAFGGSCLPKDIRALQALAREAGTSTPLLDSVLTSNAARIAGIAAEIKASGARRVALLGLSFKTGTDDLRESPYLLLAEAIAAAGIELRIHDPDVELDRLLGANQTFVSEHLPSLPALLTSLDSALMGADAVVLAKRLLGGAIIPDGVRVFDIEYTLART